MNTIKRIFIIVISLILPFSFVYSWNGLVAENGDFLSLTKWNELIGYVDTKIEKVVLVRIPFIWQTNLNQNTTGTTIVLASPSIDTIWVTINTNIITLPAGIYEFIVTTSLETTSPRTNLWWIAKLDGVEYSRRFGSNYIRSAWGHNQSGDTYSDIFELSWTGTLSFEGYRMATTGIVTLSGDGSFVNIKKLQ